MRSILFDSHRASKRFVCATFAALVALACQSKVQQTSIDIGGGKRKGDPPMCFQYRVEAQPTMQAYNHFVHINNSCRYAVDCTFHDDLTNTDHSLPMPAHQTASYQLAQEVETKRIDVDAECVWSP